MNREIYTYTDLRSLGSIAAWKHLKYLPQITATVDMQKSLKGREMRDKVDGIFKDDHAVRVSDIRKLMELVLPHWTDDDTKFRETIILSQFLRNRIAEASAGDETYNWLIGCRRNLGSLRSAIAAMEEADVSPEDIDAANDRNVALFVDAWKYLKDNDSTIDQFHKRMHELSTRVAWEPVFNQLFGITRFDAIVFHGFFYITPVQERVLRKLEQAGIQVIFLFPYDERYPYANEIWRKTYSVENGYPDISKWHIEKGSKYEAYGEIFEGRQASVPNDLKIKEYASIMEFVHGIKRAKEQGYFVYSANSRMADGILKDFYPEEYGERKLLSYPIGQFVSTLNQMWDEDLQQIVLDEDRVIECFSSGWLAADGVSAKQYLQDLVYIMPFFSNCKSVEEWEQRIGLLRDIEENVVAPFKKDLDVDDNKARWQEIMGNPFLNFSIFSVAPENLAMILRFIEQLLAMAKDLFSSTKTVRVQDHIRKLDTILKQHELSNELYEEERELIRDLFEKLSDPSGFSAEVYPADISSALNLYMSGKFQEGEIQANRIGMVSPLYQIDAAIIKHDGYVHVCLCDIGNMPGGKNDYIWPITSSLIRRCESKKGNSLIHCMRNTAENAYICNRYLMYSALRNPHVELSWIRDMGDKLMAPSPYIRLICDATGIDLKPPIRNTVTYNSVKDMPTGSGRIKAYDKNKMPMDTAKEAKMDYALCPMKYALGYVVDRFPTFQSEFHQNYAINGLIAAIHSLMRTKGLSLDEIYKNVITLFPAMRRVEKRQIYDYLQYESSFQDEDYEGRSELAEVAYTDERLKARFPNKNVRAQALHLYGKLGSPDGRLGMDLYKTAADLDTDPQKKTNIDVCLFCQHQNYCRNAVFAVDAEALYD